MFTGIITDIGKVAKVGQRHGGKVFTIATSYDTQTIATGASVAHNGICLTVTRIEDNTYDVEAWEEALRLTTADTWEIDTRLNLERALRVGDELGGHIVSGHVDGTSLIEAVSDEGEARRFTLRAPDDLARFIAPKGSVALDGTSLTVNTVEENRFDVLLIRHSLEATNWEERKAGDRVNIEIDTMARYAARLADFPGVDPT